MRQLFHSDGINAVEFVKFGGKIALGSKHFQYNRFIRTVLFVLANMARRLSVQLPGSAEPTLPQKLDLRFVPRGVTKRLVVNVMS